MPDVVPFLTYEDGIAALEWLAEMFGSTETAHVFRWKAFSRRNVDRDGLIMLASPSADYPLRQDCHRR